MSKRFSGTQPNRKQRRMLANAAQIPHFRTPASQNALCASKWVLEAHAFIDGRYRFFKFSPSFARATWQNQGSISGGCKRTQNVFAQRCLLWRQGGYLATRPAALPVCLPDSMHCRRGGPCLCLGARWRWRWRQEQEPAQAQAQRRET